MKPDPCVTIICEVHTTKKKNEKLLILITDGVASCLVSKSNQLELTEISWFSSSGFSA